jgi:hypothetical protein
VHTSIVYTNIEPKDFALRIFRRCAVWLARWTGGPILISNSQAKRQNKKLVRHSPSATAERRRLQLLKISNFYRGTADLSGRSLSTKPESDAGLNQNTLAIIFFFLLLRAVGVFGTGRQLLALQSSFQP